MVKRDQTPEESTFAFNMRRKVRSNPRRKYRPGDQVRMVDSLEGMPKKDSIGTVVDKEDIDEGIRGDDKGAVVHWPEHEGKGPRYYFNFRLAPHNNITKLK